MEFLRIVKGIKIMNAYKFYRGILRCTLKNEMHTQNSSSIKKHLGDSHQINKIFTADLILNTKILKSVPCKRELLITEALNSQTEFSDRILKIFTH